MTSKITPEARARCAAHSLPEQLAQLRAIHALELALVEKRQATDLNEAERAARGRKPEQQTERQRLRASFDLPVSGGEPGAANTAIVAQNNATDHAVVLLRDVDAALGGS